MNFAMTPEQIAIEDAARRFADARIAPFALAWDQARHLPVDTLREAAALGFASPVVSEAHGGPGLTRLDTVILYEALARGCPTIAAFLSIHAMVAGMIDRFGSEALRTAWLPKLCRMDAIASYCLTEPGSGSDAAALTTRAERVAGGYALTGSKAFISGAGVSDLYLVMARTGGPGPKGVSALLVEKGAAGFSVGAVEKKMGWNAQPTAALHFDGCVTPFENLIGVEGEGFKYAMQALDGGRLTIAACSLGGAATALERAMAHLRQREAFGRKLADFQALQFKLADMRTELEAARLFLRSAAWSLDQGAPDASMRCAMAKRYVTDSAFAIANEALQLHGGYGYLADYGVEKIMRDLRVHQILEGANEVMRVIIFRAMAAGL